MGTYISVALRRIVYERAGSCCEYCLIPETAVLAKQKIEQADITAIEDWGIRLLSAN